MSLRPVLAILMVSTTQVLADGHTDTGLTYGPRPAWLISQMDDGALKTRLQACLSPLSRAPASSNAT